MYSKLWRAFLQCEVCCTHYMLVLVVTRDAPIFANIQYWCQSNIGQNNWIGYLGGKNAWSDPIYQPKLSKLCTTRLIESRVCHVTSWSELEWDSHFVSCMDYCKLMEEKSKTASHWKLQHHELDKTFAETPWGVSRRKVQPPMLFFHQHVWESQASCLLSAVSGIMFRLTGGFYCEEV